MKKVVLALTVGMFLLPPAANAQDDPAFVFGIYYKCNQALEARADEVVRDVFGPVAQKHVDAGHLTGWLWLTHSQGGEWRRIMVTTGTDLGQMMDVREQMVAEITESHADDMNDLAAACPTHDDYIWQGVDFSTSNVAIVGAASVSAYHTCQRSREARADEIFTELLGPLYQKHIDLGHLNSYSFYAHRAGGEYRRLETVSGADHTTVLNMQGAVYNEAFETDPVAVQEFLDICNTHTDYMWTNTTN